MPLNLHTVKNKCWGQNSSPNLSPENLYFRKHQGSPYYITLLCRSRNQRLERETDLPKVTQLWLLLLLLLSRFSRVQLCATHRRQPTRLPHPWDSPGKNTGVGCHFLPQCMKVKSESEVAQSSPTLRDPMDCSLPGFSVHGIFQARVLEWGAIAFSMTSRD